MNTANTITLPKAEFIRLKEQAEAYKQFASRVFTLPLRDTVDEVVEDFKATDLYTDDFLYDLEDGLRKSSYNKRYAN